MTVAPGQPASDGRDYRALAIDAVAAVDCQPGNVGALLHAAVMLLHAGDIALSERFARDAVTANGGSVAALRTLSGVLERAGQRAEAITVAHDAIALDPANAELRLHLGCLLAADRRWREAAEHLSIHVISPAATPLGWRMLSSALHQAGNTTRAIDAAREAVTANPDALEYRLNLVFLLTARALHDQALEAAHAALAQAPANAVIWLTLSRVHVAMAQLSEALKAAERAVELADDDLQCRAHLAHVAGLCALPVPSAEPVAPPAAWSVDRRYTNRRRPVRRAPSLSEDITTRWRVIYAIMLRDIRTRFGHTKLGYFWALVEPITHLMTLGLVFYAMNHGPAPVGDNLFLFYITGLIPYLMFAHISYDVMGAAEESNVMLQLPIVKRTDIMAAHALRQLATEILVGCIIFSIAALLGQRGVPADPLTAMAGVTLLALLAVGIGAFNLVIVQMFPSYHTFYTSLVRVLYVASGIYYSAIAMPDWIRDGLAWNPILQGIELFRSGFFPHYDPHWLDVNYLLLWVVASLGIGLSLERSMRGRMVVHS